MKILAVVVLSIALSFCGCKVSSSGAGTGTQTAPSLPEGASSPFDATSYRTIADTHAAIAAVQQNVANGTLKITDQQKATLNEIIADQNTAQQLWKAYHANATGDTAMLTTAIQKLVADVATITTMLGGK